MLTAATTDSLWKDYFQKLSWYNCKVIISCQPKSCYFGAKCVEFSQCLVPASRVPRGVEKGDEGQRWDPSAVWDAP